MKNKCVFTIGPESSGSKLIAKIISHALNIHEYGEWDGFNWSDKGKHKVLHRSLPSGSPPKFPNIEQCISDNIRDYDIYFVLTTRDITISENSRMDRYSKSLEQVQIESEKAKEMMAHVLHSGHKCFIWSYETFMFLRKEYLRLLYDFLDLDSDFTPPVADGNKNRITSGRLPMIAGLKNITKFIGYLNTLISRWK